MAPLVTGESAAREAIRLDESRWAYHSTLALVLERAGKLAQAAECLEQAVNLATDPWRETLIKRRQTIERRLQADRIAN
jgi:predicted RNA polymerase sigma factor